jgi:hypothetical protein
VVATYVAGRVGEAGCVGRGGQRVGGVPAEVVDVLITGGLLVSDAPAHVPLEVVQVVGRERGMMLAGWPAQAP